MSEGLLDVLRSRTGVPGLAFREAPQRLGGGFWAELLTFSLAGAPAGWDGELVARIMPDAVLAAKETLMQATVAAAGVPTPIVRASGGPEDGLGRAFMVMDRAPGAPLLAGLDSLGAILGAPRRLWRMPDVLASVMARLHAVDPEPVRDRLGALDGVATTVDEMLDRLRGGAVGIGRDDLAGAAGWLVDHSRASSDTVICHGDLHPFNVLVDGTGQITVLDWTASLLAPRAYDVAFTSLMLATPPLMVPPAARPLVLAAGRRLASRFVRRYRHHSGALIEPAEVDWHQALVALRALVEVGQWMHEGAVDAHRGHPWLVSGDAFATRLSAITSVQVRSR